MATTFYVLWIVGMTSASPTTTIDEAQGTPRALMPRKHFDVIDAYCLNCHDSETAKGDVNLEDLSFDIGADIPTAERWQNILNAINSGEMPPEKKKPISPAKKTAFLEDLSTRMVLARKILGDNGGVITMRRLNRREYQNTLNDLLGVRPNVSGLPDDQSSGGFDTAGASLFFSSDQLEQYLAVARQTLELALAPRTPSEAKTLRVEAEDQATAIHAEKAAEYQDTLARSRAFQAQSQKPATAFGFIDTSNALKAGRGALQFLPQRQDYLQRPETQHGATLISTIKSGITRVKLPQISEPFEQDNMIRVRAGAYPNVEARYHYLEFSSISAGSGSTKRLGWRKATGTLDEPQIIEFPVTLPAGQKVQYFVHQRTHQGRGDKNLWAMHRETNPVGTPPGLWVDWVELVRPGHDGERSEAAKAVLFEQPDDWGETRYAREVIRRFASRAFRTEEPALKYLDKLVERFEYNRAKGQGFREAIIESLSIVLASPSFLYMVESSGGQTLLSELELAVRLSYFLWSAPPDAELLAAARSGRLSDSAELERQTSRLLADARSEQFVRGFLYQWLGMERLGIFEFKAAYYPLFDNGAQTSAGEEIFQTVQMMIAKKLPLKTLLKADFVVVNDLMADYYKLPGVEGHAFRKVSVPADLPRGGLLGSAAVLAMGSDGLRTSPVERGAWVLRHLLNDPPPPAPANVPQLSRFAGEVLPARELQIAHQEEPQCTQCHMKIDPIGYGLENFDASGTWRDVETVRFGNGGKESKDFPIDATGELPSGRAFYDYDSLRDAVAEHNHDFARGFTETLIAYGLGRPYGFTDQNLADTILKRANTHDYEISLFIHALVQSKTFQSK